MSLIELSLAAALGALVLGITIQFFLQALRVGDRSVIRSRLQQTGIVALLGLVQDLQEANAGGLTFKSNEAGQMLHCLVHPVEDINGEGLPQYSSQRLVHYVWDQALQRLTRRSFDRRKPSPIPLRAGEPMRFSLEQIQRLQSAPARQKLYNEVASFSISTPGVDPQFVGNPLRVELILSTAGERVQCLRSVVLRNSL
ncbi:hypothetical protein JST97_23440 [bacterium]|nr:hypothetical protein [bacterium]